MAMAGRSIHPLVMGRVVGDVVDPFIPTVDLKVRYSSRQVANGCEMKPSAAVDRPLVLVNSPSSSSDFFTLVMVDPDAPSPSDPELREWLHWVVLDIPGGMDASKGKEVMEYMGPRPLAGIHRYVFSLFKQHKPLGSASDIHWPDQAVSVRGNFNTRRFASANNLGLPVAVAYFNSKKETARKLR